MSVEAMPKEIFLPRTKRRWPSVATLSAASFVDKGEDNALSILWPYMYPSLGLSVGQLGPVLGISKLVMTLTLPLWGFAADRFSRKTLLVWLTGIWGLWTLGIGLVDTLPQLIVVRVLSSLGVGVFAPAAFSLVGDLFDDKVRGRVAGIMESIGIIGLVAAFGILPALAARGPEAWRTGFMVMGVASFVTGLLLMAFVHEPPRGASESELGDVITNESARYYTIKGADLRVLTRIRSWRLLLLKDLLDAAGFGIISGWAFTWFDELNLSESAFIVFFLMFLGSVIGHMSAGWIGDRVAQRFPHQGRVAVILAGLGLLPILTVFFIMSADKLWLLTGLGFLIGLAHSATAEGVSWPLAQAVLPPELRGSGRGTINMVAGLAGALMFSFSGLVVDRVGVTSMLLMVIPIPMVLAIVVWFPMFRAYPVDREALHKRLAQQRADLLEEPEWS